MDYREEHALGRGNSKDTDHAEGVCVACSRNGQEAGAATLAREETRWAMRPRSEGGRRVRESLQAL